MLLNHLSERWKVVHHFHLNGVSTRGQFFHKKIFLFEDQFLIQTILIIFLFIYINTNGLVCPKNQLLRQQPAPLKYKTKKYVIKNWSTLKISPKLSISLWKNYVLCLLTDPCCLLHLKKFFSIFKH